MAFTPRYTYWEPIRQLGEMGEMGEMREMILVPLVPLVRLFPIWVGEVGQKDHRNSFKRQRIDMITHWDWMLGQ